MPDNSIANLRSTRTSTDKKERENNYLLLPFDYQKINKNFSNFTLDLQANPTR